MHKVKDFIYNGFYVQGKRNYCEYKVVSFIHWTVDPGVGLFLGSDKKERLIPTCQIGRMKLPKQPKTGILFGVPFTGGNQ